MSLASHLLLKAEHDQVMALGIDHKLFERKVLRLSRHVPRKSQDFDVFTDFALLLIDYRRVVDCKNLADETFIEHLGLLLLLCELFLAAASMRAADVSLEAD